MSRLSPVQSSAYPPFPHLLPEAVVREGAYELAFVRSSQALDDLFRLRFDVFNVELKEGLASSTPTQRDQDAFDVHCHHLVVRHWETGEAVGTYRMQTASMARSGIGLYSAQEFDFRAVPASVLDASVEIGRACIERHHRSLKVLYLLWKGLGIYAARNRARYLFGCCSLTSQDLEEGRRMHVHLQEHGHIESRFAVTPNPGYACGDGPAAQGPIRIPRLMQVYLSLGARICGPPAIDRSFRTIDYLALIDLEALDARRFAFYGLEA